MNDTALFLRVMYARAYPRILCLGRLPGWIALDTLLPVLGVSALVFVYRAMQAPEEFVGFVILGGAMTAFWLNVLWSMGAQLYWDREAGNLELYIASPAPMMAILAGMALGGMAMTLVRACAIVILGALVFQVSFAPSSWLALAGVFAMTMLALYGLGMVFASVFLLWGRQALHIVSLLQEPVYVLSGLNFPVKILGTTIATAAAALPLTVGTDALRQIIFPHSVDIGLMPVWMEVMLLAISSVLFIALARYTLNWLERKARTEGRLTVRWMQPFSRDALAERVGEISMRTLRCAIWLGWQVETNWTSPWIFLIYVLIKPLAGSMLLVCMYWAACSARGGATETGYLSFLYVSSACFMVIGGVTYGMSTSVVTDRDSFGMLKFVRISPTHFQTYLIGRGVAKAAQAVIGAGTTVVVGLLLFPELREALLGGHIAWAWLPSYLVLGTAMAAGIGLILSGAVLNMARYGIFLSEGVAGMLYLFSGAVFPIDMLPAWLRPVSLALPPTYWLEGMRRTLLGKSGPASALNQLGHLELTLALVASTVVVCGIALVFFRWSENRAWRLGRYDEVGGI